jgi:prepilin-type N-terminal cleavage/methylation domain-containing protein
MRSKAFTIIELLVVVSIIALLIAILLPSLARARNAASAAVCLNNIRQLALGSHLYAQERRDWLPTTKQVNATLNRYWDTHQFQYFDFGSQGGLASLGWLHQAGIVRPGSTYYCPLQSVASLKLAAYAPWVTPMAHSTFGAVVRIGYFFNPHTRDANGNLTNNVPQQRMYQRSGDMQPGRVLLVETFQSQAATSHRDPTGWNVAHHDGSGRFVSNATAWGLMSHPDFANRRWVDFNTALDRLAR